jgi:hypothetical protein
MAVSTIDPAGLNIGQIGGRRNLIINGAMQVAQRGTSSTGIGASSGYFTVDRWYMNFSTNNDNLVMNMEQSSDAPDGFNNSLKLTVATPETAVEGDEQAAIQYRIEAQDLQSLAFGASAAKSFTVSFWVKSSVTGTFALNAHNIDVDRLTTRTFSVNTTNTWEYKSVSISGDVSGSFNNDNGLGLQLSFYLMAGPDREGTPATNWIAYNKDALATGINNSLCTTSSATFYLTGVQLELGDVATPFEHRSAGEELNSCKRYFERLNFLGTDYVLQGQTGGASTTANGLLYYTEKRTAPTVTLPSAGTSSGTITFLNSTGGYPSSVGSHTIQVAGPKQCRVYGSGYSGLTAGSNSILFSTGTTSVDVDAEL